MIKALVGILFLVGGLVFSVNDAQADPKQVIYLQPLGMALPQDIVDEVRLALSTFYGMEIKVLKPLPLPQKAYYKPRRRYRAEKLLDYLETAAPADTSHVLGITAVDISTTKGTYKDWGVMGLATLDGRACVISMFRCKRGSRSAAHARHRFAKVAVHEIGHTLGLEHCPTHGCLMEDARGTNKTCDREYLLCPLCRKKLTAWGYVLPEDPQPPWPKP